MWASLSADSTMAAQPVQHPPATQCPLGHGDMSGLALLAQIPLEQEAALQGSLDAQGLQAPPPVPQAMASLPDMHLLPDQHPLQQTPALQVPPGQALPAGSSLYLQPPDRQWSEVHTSPSKHLAQEPPAAPHSEVLLPG